MAKKSVKLPREADRNKIPLRVKHQLLMEAGYRCGNPKCPAVIMLHLHHIQYVSESGSDDPSNLLVLCPYCHEMHHAGHIPVEAIRLWKGLLLALNQAFDRKGMELLRFLYETRTNSTPLWYSADGVLQFASLLAAGLVQLGEQITAIPWQLPESRHRVLLSERGTLLIEAWMAGDEKRYLELIQTSPQ